MRTLIIRGSEWLRKNKRNFDGWNGRRYTAALKNDEGKMCCLGIMGRECGVSGNSLLNRASPESLAIAGLANACVLEWVKTGKENNKNACDAMKINDILIKDDEKIKRLRPIFKAQGWEIDWRPKE